MITPFGAARLLGSGPWPSGAGCRCVGDGGAGRAALAPQRQPDLHCATRLSATVLAVPLMLLYDELLFLAGAADGVPAIAPELGGSGSPFTFRSGRLRRLLCWCCACAGVAGPAAARSSAPIRYAAPAGATP